MNNIFFQNRNEFRDWLKANHSSSEGIWMIYYKEKTDSGIKYDEALEEAICFGWIDSLIKKIDDLQYVRKFTPRKANSKWSEKNKNLASKLIENGKMTKHGIELISEAKKNGLWNVIREAPSKSIADKDIKEFIKCLDKYSNAKDKLNKMSKSMQKIYTSYYLDAKKEETRKRRLGKIAEYIMEGKTIF